MGSVASGAAPATRAAGPDDLPALLEIATAADRAILGESDWTLDDLRDELDGAAAAWVVELDGRPAGFGLVEARGPRLIGDGYVHPLFRGRGVGGLLVDLYERWARDTERGRTLESAALRGDGGADTLFRGRGYEPVRHFYRMVIDLEAEPAPPRWPDGVRGERFDLRHAEAFHAALNEAFADEWDFAPEPFEEYYERRLRAERFDPTLCTVAWAGDEIAGLAKCDWKTNGDWGWVASLGVRQPWRRLGLGEALLRQSFGEFWRRGERRVALGVDAQNPTGATRLYERVGMRVFWEAVVYRKPLHG